MKYIKLFDTTANMNAAIANSTVGFIGMADNNGNPVLNNVKVTPGPGPTPPTPSYSTPFYVENITQDDETLSIEVYDPGYGFGLDITVEYSTNGTTWNTLGTIDAEEPLTIELQPNNRVYLRANTDSWGDYSDSPQYTGAATIQGVSKVGGNIMSLLYGSNFTGNERSFPTGSSSQNFKFLFYFNSNLISAEDLLLPATTVTDSCYYQMFYGCEGLTSAPALPATTLSFGCYEGMFCQCTSLTSAPELPATTLAIECYRNMFYECTLLTTAPSLPATTLTDYCYDSMFYYCYNLNYVKCLASDISASGCTREWLSCVASTGTFVKNPNMTSWTTSDSGIPSDWTVEDATE